MPIRPSNAEEAADAEIPSVHWDHISDRLGDFWLPKMAPHISIISQNGGGKSYLIANGILSRIPDEKVCIIDCKGDDETWQEIGKPVKKLPRRGGRNFWQALGKDEPREHWYRLVVSHNVKEGREQVRKALADMYKEGDWTIVLDETRNLTDPREPNLNLQPQVEALWLRGRSRGISVIAATQGPRWVPRSFFDQAQFHFIGVVEDADSQKRLLEIGGMERYHFPAIKGLPLHHFVYTDRQSEDGKRFRAITKVE